VPPLLSWSLGLLLDLIEMYSDSTAVFAIIAKELKLLQKSSCTLKERILSSLRGSVG
jgi:hypothetical protein